MEQTEVTTPQTETQISHIEISPEEIIIYFQRLKHRYESFGISHYLPPVSTKEMIYSLFKDKSEVSSQKRDAIIPYLYALLEISASRNAFKCHDECFHIDWLEFYRCPQTTINECILIIQEAQLIARKYRRSIEDMNAMLAESEKLKVSQFDARNAVQKEVPTPYEIDQQLPVSISSSIIENINEESQRDISTEPVEEPVTESNEPIEYQGADKEITAPSIPVPSVPVRKFFVRK